MPILLRPGARAYIARAAKLQAVSIRVVHNKRIVAPAFSLRRFCNRQPCLLQLLIKSVRVRNIDLYMRRNRSAYQAQLTFANRKDGVLTFAMIDDL